MKKNAKQPTRSIRVDAPLWKRLRLLSVEKEMTMTELLEILLEKFNKNRQ